MISRSLESVLCCLMPGKFKDAWKNGLSYWPSRILPNAGDRKRPGKTRKELEVIKQSADEASDFAESVINTVREPLISLDKDLRVVTVSRSFYDSLK